MTVKDGFAQNNNISIHYLDTIHFDPTLTPLVYVPGALGNAEQFQDEIEEFLPRRSISVSLRGMGKSDAPAKGYSLEDHVSNILSLVKGSVIASFCLMAYSMSVPYAIKFATQHPDTLKGLIVCDYPARYPNIPPSWTEQVLRSGMIEKDREHVVKGIQQESKEIYFWNELQHITCPVLVLKGGTGKGVLTSDDADRYKVSLENVEVIEFSESGHELWKPDYRKFINTIKEFLSKLDEYDK